VNINIFESGDDDDDDDDDDEDDDDDDIFIQRRPYTIRNSPNNFQKWDDTEFFERFLLKKIQYLTYCMQLKTDY